MELDPSLRRPFQREESDDELTANTPKRTLFQTPKQRQQKQQQQQAPAVPATKEDNFEEAAVPAAIPAAVPIHTIFMDWSDELNDIVQRANQPILNLLGAVAVKLRLDDVRSLMTYDAKKKDPREKLAIVQGYDAKTVEEWARSNAFLGPQLLGLYLKSVTVDQWKLNAPILNINACLDIRTLDRGHLPEHEYEHATRAQLDAAEQRVIANPNDANALRNRDLIRAQLELQDGVDRVYALLAGQEAERVFSPAWAFGVIPEAAFIRFISPTAWSAIQMAVGYITRLPRCQDVTLKELACSESVLDYFATVVAYHYLNTGDATGITGGGGGTIKRARNGGKTYLNVNTARNEMSERMALIAEVFSRDVYKREHPLLAHFDQRISTLSPEEQVGMAVYRQHFPQRMLVVRL